ncbi:immunoglobulin-like domain-containing protein [Vibrio aquimaris]|uniref:chitinase n=1 Tax=Vibrio aquimaris TaxID=2587862 RepID=A0A5P9CR21_9VIBR|nr:immunoglobulin-like domain-containing protein [Vibrio aquimaris]QFT28709.1 Chitinase D precursor [Vibrio aquimaris]
MNRKTALALSILSAFSLGSSQAIASDGQQLVDQDGNVLVGYWHNWCEGDGYKGGNAPCVELADVDPQYNVVNVSFMKVYDTAAGHIPTFHLDPDIGLSEEEFKAQIAELNAQGRSVQLALGGADAHIELHSGDEQALADEIIRLVDTYGFDGLDIDLEQAAISAADNQTVIPAALRQVKDHYRDQGHNFMITMAPEFPYLQLARGDYIPYLNGLDGYYDFINPQFYNQAGDGVWVPEVGDSGTWVPQNYKDQDVFIYYIADSIINGTRGYTKIPHEKLVFGIPANPDAAGSGFVSNPNDIYKSLDSLREQGQPLRGIMTWSINWDMGTNSGGQQYDEQFVKDYGPYVHGQTPPPTDGKPSISGIGDDRTPFGSSYDKMAGVSATDAEDGDLTGDIVVSGEVNTNRVGAYPLTYSVTDSDSNTTEEVRQVTVYNTAPVINGINNETILVNSDFDPMEGVSATDAEDGDISNSAIQVSGQVNTEIVGQYTLTYQVTDAAGETTTNDRIITVTDEETGSGTWDPEAIYNTGDQVLYNGVNYTAQWWTQGDEPGTSAVWQAEDDGQIHEWSSTQTYTTDDLVTYHGQTYRAKWWSQGNVPTDGDPWTLN